MASLRSIFYFGTAPIFFTLVSTDPGNGSLSRKTFYLHVHDLRPNHAPGIGPIAELISNNGASQKKDTILAEAHALCNHACLPEDVSPLDNRAYTSS